MDNLEMQREYSLIKKLNNFKTFVWKIKILDEFSAMLSYGYKNSTLTNRKIEHEAIFYEVKERIKKKLEENYLFEDELSLSDSSETSDTEDFGKDDPNYESLFPQLAETFNPDKVNLDTEVLYQDKMDGVRCLAVMKPGSAELYSRTGILFENQDHIIEELRKLYDNVGEMYLVFDGELYHHNLSFDRISGIARRKKITSKSKLVPGIPKLQYHVFDIVNNKVCSERLKDIENYSKVEYKYIKFVNSNIGTMKEYKEYHDKAAEKGYEGIMMRRLNSYYKSTRSSGLFKYKKFTTDEFEILDIISGKGEDHGCAIIVTETKCGNGFAVRPKGSKESRKKMLQNKEDYIGKMYTVKYFTLYEKTNIPRFPVGIAVRDYE